MAWNNVTLKKKTDVYGTEYFEIYEDGFMCVANAGTDYQRACDRASNIQARIDFEKINGQGSATVDF